MRIIFGTIIDNTNSPNYPIDIIFSMIHGQREIQRKIFLILGWSPEYVQ